MMVVAEAVVESSRTGSIKWGGFATAGGAITFLLESVTE